jgi:hypothetical protein
MNIVSSKDMPLLVLLPGLDGTGQMFQPLLTCLKDEIRTHMISYVNLYKALEQSRSRSDAGEE